ncbi:hypothetical protein AB0K48_20725 [Nonomuraea sp. NPDC055795]
MGTLLGSSLTYLFQSRTSSRTELFTRDERLRQERITVYSAYVGAMFDLRRSLVDLWKARRDESCEPATLREIEKVKIASRLAAYQALARVILVTDDEHVTSLARAAIELNTLDKVESEEELGSRRKAIRLAVETFIEAAAVHVK